jgi:integrase
MHYTCLLLVGRWLAREHPAVRSPEDWTREFAVEYVAAVNRLRVGDWAYFQHKSTQGSPLAAATKSRYLSVVCRFFTDLQEWGWIPRRFDPQHCLAVPRSVQGLLVPNPKPVDGALWKKLTLTALQLSEVDLRAAHALHYPLALVRALAVAWIFSGLRPDEIRRLRVGCIRLSETPGGNTCWLEVPANKRNPAYSKPVDAVVGAAVTAWERERPVSEPRIDPKSGQAVDFLFAAGGRYISHHYLATTLIPLLCRMAGIPSRDSRGAITPNRARHTVAYQLANGRDPMPLLELQAWMGHRSPDSTLHYTTRTPVELSRALAQHTETQTRLVAVLVDREAVASGAAGRGETWKYYDVGHGYCTFDFFETCPHRMACARCTSYVPKASGRPELEEARQHLLHLREAIPLTMEMVKAVEDGVEAMTALLNRLTDVPTPSGQTPRELGTMERNFTLISPTDIPVR